MFCYQCEQTTRSESGDGCATAKGVCGKDSATADLQDLLVYAIKGIAQYAKRARALGKTDKAADGFILFGLFTTLTNVNFTASRFVSLVMEAAQHRDRVKALYEAAAQEQGITPEILTGAAAWIPATTQAELLIQSKLGAMNKDADTVGEDIVGLRAMMIYGIKGLAAYAHHAHALGYEDEEIYARLETALDFLANDPTDAGELLTGNLEVGAINLKVMELLDAANTGRFGQQEPANARISHVKGKAILVSGHDLQDLYTILEQTKDKGINVYTHGELLPAHAYPKLRSYSHLVGNYGGAWQNQNADFAAFPGAIVMTSNCLIEPAASYRQRIFTAGPVGWQGVRHITDDFTPVIQAALALAGFQEDEPERTLTVGFGHHAVLGVADKVIDAVKSGAIKHFFLIGGCDGAAPGRNYYTDVAEMAPKDTVVMTLGCGKYRFHEHDFGNIGGIPRLLDIGQCNDAYSAIQIASALAGAFECGVNDLPLSLMISWFEQKAVAVLLSLLSLGIRGIHLGPTLPAFLTPSVLAILVEKFDIRANGEPADDLAMALNKAA
ncbi:MAG: hydroxylamine reductase [Methylococcales bacterium]|nr:hydroxylamine reductase [Methylococcales bacterium]MDP3837833.1 hydroxylamine reductase [Methylococcales bacterium]